MTDLDRIEALAKALDPIDGDVPAFTLSLTSAPPSRWECRCGSYLTRGTTKQEALAAMVLLLRGKVEQRARLATAALLEAR